VTAVAADLLKGALPLDVSPADGRETAEVRRLVDAARAGDRDAFGTLVALNQRAVLRAAMAALGDAAEAEDVAQDACLVAWRKLATFRGDATFRTWLLTIVWRKALDRRKHRRLRRWLGRRDDEDVGAMVDRIEEPGADPERQTMSRDLVRRTAAEIRALSPKLRDALLLAATGEHSYADIAAMLGIPLGTLKWRVSEARRIVGERLR
jgi:RNA polymerase sigma-70 factor (ECF subfamily)